jgi:hypothetical protein
MLIWLKTRYLKWEEYWAPLVHSWMLEFMRDLQYCPATVVGIGLLINDFGFEVTILKTNFASLSGELAAITSNGK